MMYYIHTTMSVRYSSSYRKPTFYRYVRYKSFRMTVMYNITCIFSTQLFPISHFYCLTAQHELPAQVLWKHAETTMSLREPTTVWFLGIVKFGRISSQILTTMVRF